MSTIRPSILGVIFLLVIATVASAGRDPTANCRQLVSEEEFQAAGAKLIVTSPAKLTDFPRGFLHNCQGNIEIRAVVKEDGSVDPLGTDHGVACGVEAWNPAHGWNPAFEQSIGWHYAVVLDRFSKLRFAPPRMAGKPVCVKIDRGWVPDTPNRLWSSEEWAHRR